MSFDRRAAAILWAAAVIGLGVTAVVAGPWEPEVHHDDEAYAELLVAIATGEDGDWLVRYAESRVRPDGERLDWLGVEGQLGDARVLLGATSVATEQGDEGFVCNVVEAGVECLPVEVPPRQSATIRIETLVDAGFYVVERLPGETIAGEDAGCYRVFGTQGYDAAYGVEREYCFGADGVLLRGRVVQPDNTDERIATEVTRGPSAADLQAIVTEFEAAAEVAAEAAVEQADG